MRRQVLKRIVLKGIEFLGVFLLATGAMPPSVAWGIPDDCACPPVDCGKCASPEGVTFFTDKCAGGTRVKSCTRPTCLPLNPPPSGCVVAAQGRGAEDRGPASLPNTLALSNPQKIEVRTGPEIGVAVGVTGQVWVVDSLGAKTTLSDGVKLRVGDKLVAGPDGRTKVTFTNGNEIFIAPNTELELTQVDSPHSDSKKTLLGLLKGKVRNKVQQKYKGADSFYRVQTRGAVAGVRGTDFVISYETSERLITKVETLKGEVQLSELSGEQSVGVGAGQYASYVVAANDAQVFDQEDISEFVARGYMTPVYELSAADVKAIEKSTATVERSLASTSPKDTSPICASPRGQLNECSWVCENNPKGSARCRTDLPQVNCLRRRCNANGEWKEDSRLPASLHEACQAEQIRVAPCDY